LTEKIEALQLEAQIVPLSDLRDTERAVSAALRHLIAPARSLPVELLRSIFSLAFRHLDAPHGRDFHISWQRKYHIQDAYRLSHVCSDWQAAALGTPEIWVASPLVVSPSGQSVDSYAEGLGSWFARSAQLPLSLSLQRSAEAPQMANEILAVASRCRSLRFPRTVSASFLLQLGNISRSSLEELEICDDVERDVRLGSISCFTEMPRLRKLTLDLQFPIPMPWDQLTDISVIHRDRHDDLYTILQECEQLVRVHISIQMPDNGFSILLYLIVLNHLRVLKLSSDVEERKWDVMSTLLDCILAPSLDELSLENPGKLDENSLTRFQLRSPDITKLSLAGPNIDISSHALKSALRHAPLLTHLSIEQCPMFTLEMLTRVLASPDSDSQFLVPRLNVLTLTDLMWHGPGVIDAVHSLIRARWWTNDEIAAGLKRTTVEPWSRVNIRDVSAYTGDRYRISREVLDRIDSLRQTGLDVDMEVAEWKKGDK
ncbi:F-box domain-containing protein, partial [Favolaschia claudopus]